MTTSSAFPSGTGSSSNVSSVVEIFVKLLWICPRHSWLKKLFVMAGV